MSEIYKNQVSSEDNNHWLPWIYYQFRFDPVFKTWIEKLVDWADYVILEYPFWAVTVGEICQQYQKKLIITAHDVLSKQLPENSLIAKIALAEEIQGLKQADYLITVSQSDRLFFQQYSLDAQVIPNPVDLERDCQVTQSLDETSKKDLEKLGETFCLFVGSFHPPNVEAVKNIRQIAKEFANNYPEQNCNFVVVGECCEPQQVENFLALGKVEYAMLSAIYQKAALILSPILAGTGTSLKTVEAMAYGKVILGTQVAFRGYPVRSQSNCIICDNLTQYPAIAASLFHAPERLREIGQNAREFAKAYDYRNLYGGYVRIMN